MADDMQILVQFDDEAGLRQVNAADADPEQLAELSGKSREAVEKALGSIGWVADRTRAVLDAAVERPDVVELEFGIKISTKAGVIVVQGEGEFHIKAKLIWKKATDE